MKKLVAVVLAGAFVLVGCGGESDEEKAQAYAMKACDIVFVDEAGNPVEDGSTEGTPQRTDTGQDKPWDAGVEPIGNLTKWSESWKADAANAAAAAQLDPAYIPLNNAVSTISELLALVVRLRNDGLSGQRFWSNQDQFTNSDVERYNAALGDYDVQCNGLTSRLS